MNVLNEMICPTCGKTGAKREFWPTIFKEIINDKYTKEKTI